MITLVGVGHVFAISDQVRNLIRTKRPQIVCIELDPARYQALRNRDSPRKVPIQYKLLSYLQVRMAGKFGTEAGDEMLAAASAAGEVGAKVALIDVDAGVVLAMLWRKMSFKEKVQLLGGALTGLVISKKTVERELERYENNEEQYLEALSSGFPTLKTILIDDRNKHMAERISALSTEYAEILAVVGDGHIPGIVQQLGQKQIETIRLRELRKSPEEGPGSAQYTSSFWCSNQ
jgi:pheromone shutdown protein TraB